MLRQKVIIPLLTHLPGTADVTPAHNSVNSVSADSVMMSVVILLRHDDVILTSHSERTLELTNLFQSVMTCEKSSVCGNVFELCTGLGVTPSTLQPTD